jgi:hypothetical protein
LGNFSCFRSLFYTLGGSDLFDETVFIQLADKAALHQLFNFDVATLGFCTAMSLRILRSASRAVWAFARRR